MRSGLLLAGLILVAGCSDERSVQFDVTDDDTLFAGSVVTLEPDDQFAVLSRDGIVKLGLTRDRVYFTASEAVREHVDETLEREMTESDSRLARAISGAVRRGVRSALRFDVDFRVDEVRDVEYVDGELVFDWVDADRGDRLDHVEVDNEPITRAFDEESGRAFVQAFRSVKRGDVLRQGALTADSVPSTGGSF